MPDLKISLTLEGEYEGSPLNFEINQPLNKDHWIKVEKNRVIF